MTSWDVLGILIKIGLVVGITQGAVAYLILVERKVAAFAQDRLGPNRVGPFGLLQPLADGAKMILKEDVIPGYVIEAALHPGPGDRDHRGDDRLRRRPVRAGRAERPARSSAGRSSSRSPPASTSGILYIFAIGSLGGLRRHPRRLGLEQQVLVPRRPALERPAHQLRDPAGDVDPGDGPAGRLARPEHDHQLAGPPRLGRSSSSRSASCSSWSAPSPRPTACRSTCPSPSRSSSAGSTPNTRR